MYLDTTVKVYRCIFFKNIFCEKLKVDLKINRPPHYPHRAEFSHMTFNLTIEKSKPWVHKA